MTNVSKNESECHLAQRRDEIEREWAKTFSEIKTCNELLAADKVRVLSALSKELADLRRTSKVGVMLREMEAFHERTFAPLRDMLDRLPKPIGYEVPDLSEALASRRAPDITINIFINQDQPND